MVNLTRISHTALFTTLSPRLLVGLRGICSLVGGSARTHFTPNIDPVPAHPVQAVDCLLEERIMVTSDEKYCCTVM